MLYFSPNKSELSTLEQIFGKKYVQTPFGTVAKNTHVIRIFIFLKKKMGIAKAWTRDDKRVAELWKAGAPLLPLWPIYR